MGFKTGWSLAMMFLFAAIMGAGAILYTNYVDGRSEQRERANDRKLCTLLIVLDDAYSSTPPTTDLGREVAAAIRKVRGDYGC